MTAGETSKDEVLRCLALAEELEPELWGSNAGPSMDRLEAEHYAMRRAMAWAIDHSETALALRLGAALSLFWQVRNHTTEGLAWMEDALNLKTPAPVEVRALALDAAGHLARRAGRYDRATSFYAGSLQAHLKLGDKRASALALTNLGIAAQLAGRQDASVAHHNASFELLREMGDPAGVGLSLVTLATMAQLQGRTDAAKTMYEESLAIFRAIGDERGVAASLNNLGNILSETQQGEAARGAYLEALSHFRSLGEKNEEAACLKNLASIELEAGRPQEATARCAESIDLFDDLADGRGVASCLELLSRIACLSDQFELSATLLGAFNALTEALDASGQDPKVAQATIPDPTAKLRRSLGDERFAAAVDEGRDLALGDVVAETLRQLHPTKAKRHRATKPRRTNVV